MFLFLAALLSSSADFGAHARAEKWAKKAKPFAECTDQASCDRKWDAARAWIAENTRFKIVVDEPNLYSTPGVIYANTDLSFTLVRKQQGEGAVLLIYAWCGNVLACKPRPKTAIAALSRATELGGSK